MCLKYSRHKIIESHEISLQWTNCLNILGWSVNDSVSFLNAPLGSLLIRCVAQQG